MPIHFQEGHKNNFVAFVLSTPGELEDMAKGPAAGETGDNISDILVHLNAKAQKYFPVMDRDFYLITNASTKVMFAAKDNKRTEDSNEAITDPGNIKRVLGEVEKCSIVILCGDKAQLVASHLRGKRVVKVSHLGNKGLRNTYMNNHLALKGISSGVDRDKIRKRLCAHNILEQLGCA